MLVKICGTTSPHDARLAQDAGADVLGIIVEHPPSPRSVSLERVQEISRSVSIPVVAVTVNLTLETLLHIHETLKPHALQLHGDEAPELVRELRARGIEVWAACHTDDRVRQMHEAGADVLLFDARAHNEGGTVYGGTGLRGDWNLAKRWAERGARVVVAGGLTPENVAQAIRVVSPWAVDVVSGVEVAKGVKDAEKVRAFISHAKAQQS